MDTIISYVLNFLSNHGPLVPYITPFFAVLVVLPALINAFVALWHTAVLFLKAGTLLPYVGKYFSHWADVAAADETVLADKSSLILNWINRLSALKPPVA